MSVHSKVVVAEISTVYNTHGVHNLVLYTHVLDNVEPYNYNAVHTEIQYRALCGVQLDYSYILQVHTCICSTTNYFYIL